MQPLEAALLVLLAAVLSIGAVIEGMRAWPAPDSQAAPRRGLLYLRAHHANGSVAMTAGRGAGRERPQLRCRDIYGPGACHHFEVAEVVCMDVEALFTIKNGWGWRCVSVQLEPYTTMVSTRVECANPRDATTYGSCSLDYGLVLNEAGALALKERAVRASIQTSAS